MSIPQFFVAEGTDHLRMTKITAFALIDVASALFEGRIRPDAGNLFDGFVDKEQRGNFD